MSQQTYSRKRHRGKKPSPTSPPSTSLYAPPLRRRSQPYLFPRAHSTVLPDPSVFFAPQLLNKPLPTNSFFQNYVMEKGDDPEYIHPYLVRSKDSKLAICYPSVHANSEVISRFFYDQLVISTKDNPGPGSTHVVSSFSDLSVTLDFLACNLRFFLVRGSPFLTCSVEKRVPISIQIIHDDVVELSPNKSRTKYVIKLKNNQVWLLYASSPIYLSLDAVKVITSDDFVGVIRIAALPHGDKKFELVLDKYSSCYPVSGDAYFSRPYGLEYKWDKVGCGELLMLAHPLHVKLLSDCDGSVTVLNDFKYDSIDGELVGVVGDCWVLKSDPITVTWHSMNGVEESAFPELIEALVKDVEALDSTSVTESSTLIHGKLIARAARLALIAEEVRHVDVIPAITKFLKEMIEPWLNGTFGPNGFLYDPKWDGIVNKQGLDDSNAESRFGMYHKHHFHLGYFVYGIAVLTKIDLAWGRKFKSRSYALLADYMNVSKRENTDYTRLRCFDLWKLHTGAAGLHVPGCGCGRYLESSGEAVNAYYAAALMGLAHGDTHLASVASTITALEIKAAQTWWHLKEEDTLYPEEYTKYNRVVGVLLAKKRCSGSLPAFLYRVANVGKQVLPITEVLFADHAFVRQAVNWAWPSMDAREAEEGWKGFVYALQGVYDREGALGNVRTLTGYDDGNSLTNLLWWIYNRDFDDDGDEDRGVEFERGKNCCWFRHYSD